MWLKVGTRHTNSAPRRRSIAYVWGSTDAERRLPYPCDKYLPGADDAYFRALDVSAPPHVLFRWLCQLKVAPYSYDWVDNPGHTSPQHLTPGVEKLETGEQVMKIFKLAEFEINRHFTLVMADARSRALFGEIAGSYVISAPSAGNSRLVGKLLIRYPEGWHGGLVRWLLPWGDFVMMRKQFLNLKRLAEGSAL